MNLKKWSFIKLLHWRRDFAKIQVKIIILEVLKNYQRFWEETGIQKTFLVKQILLVDFLIFSRFSQIQFSLPLFLFLSIQTTKSVWPLDQRKVALGQKYGFSKKNDKGLETGLRTFVCRTIRPLNIWINYETSFAKYYNNQVFRCAKVYDQDLISPIIF